MRYSVRAPPLDLIPATVRTRFGEGLPRLAAPATLAARGAVRLEGAVRFFADAPRLVELAMNEPPRKV